MTRTRQKESAILLARLRPGVSLETRKSREIVAAYYGRTANLGKFSAAAIERAERLKLGLEFRLFIADGRITDEEVFSLVRRLANHGLLDYRLAGTSGDDIAIIEAQTVDYWPSIPKFLDTDAVVLSRFAYLRRRSDALILESPRSAAIFKICNPKIATALALLSTPQPINELRRQEELSDGKFLALLVDSQVLVRTKSVVDLTTRLTEGDDNLVLWDFQDLLFHTRSTEGRHANPLGGTYAYAQNIPPPPATRPPWPGKKISLSQPASKLADEPSPITKLLRQRRSVREFADRRPITLDELSRFLERTAIILSEKTSLSELGQPSISVPSRPYPSAGSCYELELYLAVDKCDGLRRGFYYYDPRGHALTAMKVRAGELDALLTSAAYSIGASNSPQILITIAARFARVSWKYGSIAYALILKDVGVLTQTFYLMAADMGLGGCAVGIANIELFAKMTGLEFHVEGPVGQFALGRGNPDAG
jgi:SagB-type dehydrogenase family enzyme